MRTTEIKYRIPENILNSLNQNREEFIHHSRLFTALQLFKKHKVTFGQAAEIAGMKKDYFLLELDKNDIDFIDYDSTELAQELERFK
jgi:predicted HTH domain antitoxin